jgi:hypothetical protein
MDTNTLKQIWIYTLLRAQGSWDDDRDRGEVSATTIIWAAAMIAVAVAVSAFLVGKIQAKSNSISF